MEITLNGKLYTLAREMDGTPVVLVRVNARLSRVARPCDTAKVLRGLRAAMVREGNRP